MALVTASRSSSFFQWMNIQPGLFFIVAEKGIDPAPDRISRQEAVIRPDPAKPVVDGRAQGIRGIDDMVQSPVHDYNKDTLFFRFFRVFCPERPVFLITIRVEELTVERVVPLLEMLQEKPGFHGQVPGIFCIDR